MSRCENRHLKMELFYDLSIYENYLIHAYEDYRVNNT